MPLLVAKVTQWRVFVGNEVQDFSRISMVSGKRRG